MLSEIYARYAGLAFSITLKTLNDQASAEEIVQQLFTIVWRQARDYRGERGKFSSWESTITRHQCIDELRRHCAHPITDSGGVESLDRLAGKDDPASAAPDTFEQVHIREALQQIPTQQRIVIELAFWGRNDSIRDRPALLFSAHHLQDSFPSRHTELEATFTGI